MKRIWLVSQIFLAALECSNPVARSDTIVGSGRGLVPSWADDLDACIKNTYGEMTASSETTCKGNEHYFEIDNTKYSVNTITYNMGPDFAGYEYISGSQTTNYSGQCSYKMGTQGLSPTAFVCTWFTAGCGVFNGGGHIRGSCSIKIHYLPRDGDVARIKEYCFARLSGIPVSKPTAYALGCTLP